MTDHRMLTVIQGEAVGYVRLVHEAYCETCATELTAEGPTFEQANTRLQEHMAIAHNPSRSPEQAGAPS